MNVSIAIEQQSLAERHNGPELAQLVAAIDASATDVCVVCDRTLGGFLGSFQWALVHGQGECSGCGFPYVYYHYHELSPAIPTPMRYPRPAEELQLMAWVPNADIPLAEKQ